MSLHVGAPRYGISQGDFRMVEENALQSLIKLEGLQCPKYESRVRV
jgi:hypothetical protein